MALICFCSSLAALAPIFCINCGDAVKDNSLIPLANMLPVFLIISAGKDAKAPKKGTFL